MSIAVSTVVKPSRILMLLVGAMFLGAAFLLSMLIWGWIPGEAAALRLLVPLAAFPIAFAGLRHVIRGRKSLHIDISGNGQITVDEDEASSGAPGQKAEKGRRRVTVKLMPDSTIWSFMLLLRLQTEDRKVRSQVILPDCMNTEDFRALAVAARWIAVHNEPAERKIL
jgi:toxin CptA